MRIIIIFVLLLRKLFLIINFYIDLIKVCVVEVYSVFVDITTLTLKKPVFTHMNALKNPEIDVCVNTGFLSVNIGNKEITAFLRHAAKSPFCFPLNAVYFIILSFSFQIIHFSYNVLKYEYQPNR